MTFADAKTIYQKFREHPGISTDSRRITSGSLFFCLQGANFNGNHFARQALEQGAAFAVIDEAAYSTHPGCILVKDVLETLQEIARIHRRRFNIPVIAITGTNGKTTTKELIHVVLSREFRTIATQGNLNNHIGVPLTLLTLKHDTQIAIIEMGANHRGEIDQLCRIAEPNHGIITNIGKAHLEGFGGYEGVISTKTELYRFIASVHGKLFIDKDNPLLTGNAAGCSIVTYGSPRADLELISSSAKPYVEMQIRQGKKNLRTLHTRLYGGYNTKNILAAACIGRYFGVPAAAIVQAIESYEPANNRSQIIRTEANLLVMDAYNANPSSMEAAINTFAEADYENKTVILGDMLELGDETDHEHTKVMELLAGKKFREVYLVGPVFTRLNTRRENICFNDSELASLWFEHSKPTGSTILIKGSRGIKLENLLKDL